MEEKKCCKNCKYNWTQAYRLVLCEKTNTWESELYCCERWKRRCECWEKRKEKIHD